MLCSALFAMEATLLKMTKGGIRNAKSLMGRSGMAANMAILLEVA
jgi:hypothetical protein